MGTRELMLVLGAIVLFGITSLTVNRTALYNKDKIWTNEIEATAISLAQGYIEEAKTKAFDEEVVDGIPPAGLPNTFTSISDLGPEVNEAYPLFDDKDDYNGFIDTVQTSRHSFLVAIEVGYVSEAAPDSILASPTFYKKMKITVNSMPISVVFGYQGEVP